MLTKFGTLQVHEDAKVSFSFAVLFIKLPAHWLPLEQSHLIAIAADERRNHHVEQASQGRRDLCLAALLSTHLLYLLPRRYRVLYA